MINSKSDESSVSVDHSNFLKKPEEKNSIFSETSEIDVKKD